jgi:hypothetical protein
MILYVNRTHINSKNSPFFFYDCHDLLYYPLLNF